MINDVARTRPNMAIHEASTWANRDDRKRAKHVPVKVSRTHFENGDPLTLGQLLQNYRQEKGISLRELSRELGISLSMVSLMERDIVYPRRPNLDKISTLLKVSRADLLKLDKRLRMDDLRRVVEKNPELREALRLMVEQIQDGHPAESFAKALISVARRREAP
jgi:transcriptional regulator with XRE-family HTH domain